MQALSKYKPRTDLDLSKIQNAGMLALIAGIILATSPIIQTSYMLFAPAVLGLVRYIAWKFMALGAVLLIGHVLYIFITGKINQSAVEKLLQAKPESVSQVAAKSNIATVSKTVSKPEVVTAVKPVTPLTPTLDTLWHKQIFTDIEWRRFEAVCERLFAQSGFKTKSQPHGGFGGVDMWLYAGNTALTDKPVSMAQVKHYHTKLIDLNSVRQLSGAMLSHKMSHGIFVTTTSFTPEALQFANEHNIQTLDGDKILSLIHTRSPAMQQELLDVAFEGEYSVPTCARCGIKLVKKTTYWDCSNAPRCSTKIYVDAA